MYRGEVIKTGDKCLVKFIDYGNHEKVKQKYLVPEVMCSEVPSFAYKFRLDGSPIGVDGGIDESMFDCLYSIYCEKEINVEIHKEDRHITDPKKIKRCAIVVNGTIIRSYEDLKEYEQSCIRAN